MNEVFQGPSHSETLGFLVISSFIIQLYKAKQDFVGCKPVTMKSVSHASENANQWVFTPHLSYELASPQTILPRVSGAPEQGRDCEGGLFTQHGCLLKTFFSILRNANTPSLGSLQSEFLKIPQIGTVQTEQQQQQKISHDFGGYLLEHACSRLGDRLQN